MWYGGSTIIGTESRDKAQFPTPGPAISGREHSLYTFPQRVKAGLNPTFCSDDCRTPGTPGSIGSSGARGWHEDEQALTSFRPSPSHFHREGARTCPLNSTRPIGGISRTMESDPQAAASQKIQPIATESATLVG